MSNITYVICQVKNGAYNAGQRGRPFRGFSEYGKPLFHNANEIDADEFPVVEFLTYDNALKSLSVVQTGASVFNSNSPSLDIYESKEDYWY